LTFYPLPKGFSGAKKTLTLQGFLIHRHLCEISEGLKNILLTDFGILNPHFKPDFSRKPPPILRAKRLGWGLLGIRLTNHWQTSIFNLWVPDFLEPYLSINFNSEKIFKKDLTNDFVAFNNFLSW
jgi:hypothetical protein